MSRATGELQIAARPGQPHGALAESPAARTVVPTLGHVWIGLTVLAAALSCALQPLESIDFWWSARLGALIRQTGQLLPLDADPLVYTPIRAPVVDGQWLARIVLSVLHDLGGVELVLTLRTVVAAAAALLLAQACRRVGIGPRLAAVVPGLALILIVPGLAIRPQILAVVPFMLVWQAAVRPPTTLLGVAVVAGVVGVWANLHGSFILAYPLLGAGLLGAWVTWRRTGDGAPLRRLALLFGLAAVVWVVNPYGLGLAGYVGDAVLFNGGATAPSILGVEWGPPAIRTAYGGLFYGSVVLATLLLAAGRRPTLVEGLLLLGLGLLAVSSVRHVIWWAIVLTPFVARSLHEVTPELSRRGLPRPGPLPAGASALNVACLGLFGVMVVATLPWWREGLPLPPERTARLDPSTPVAVAEFLAGHPTSGRLFNETNWSAYFSWRLGPGVPVFVDNRFELHPAAVWDEYARISRGHASWQDRLDSYGVTRLALDRVTNVGLIEALEGAPGWRLVYEDRQALVFDRAAGPAGP